MMIGQQFSNVKRNLKLLQFRFQNLNKETFTCPVCLYAGPFKDISPSTGLRKHAQCPKCHSLERHRLQYLVVQHIAETLNTSEMAVLHFAPEPFLCSYFSSRFGKYETADLAMKDVDHLVDIQNLPFADASYNFIFASHVLEHIPDDRKALKEIRRILKPDGLAILPVPLVADKTVEYPEPNPYESNHVRAPGLDYFNRYMPFFSRIRQFTSDSFSEKYQLFVYENRNNWPTQEHPFRPAMKGDRHIDIIPVCYA